MDFGLILTISSAAKAVPVKTVATPRRGHGALALVARRYTPLIYSHHEALVDESYL